MADFGWSLPPGVRECDIPGNRPEDQELELYVILTRGELEELREHGTWDDDDIKQQLLDQQPKLTRREARKQIAQAIKCIEEDSRYREEPASVEINAPLALIQVDLVARLSILKWAQENL